MGVSSMWKQEVARSIRTVEQLKNYVKLTQEEEEKLPVVLQKFQMAITPYYAKLMDPNDPQDPIKKLVVPSVDELKEEGYYDTSGEEDNIKVNGLQHKYKNTVLLLPTPVCTSYCRYCFRKRFTTGKLAKKETIVDWENAIPYLQEHKEVDNVLITGGDPLILSNEKLDEILGNLRLIDHIKIIRIGTKFPAFNPFRLMDEGFLELIRKYSLPDKKIYIVAHFDHPRELTKEAIDAIDKVIKAGAHVINQAVFHKGINDNPDTLRELFKKLADSGIAPYYLFQLRPVKGSLQYRIPIKQGLEIFEESKKGLSGLARRVRYAMSHYTGKIEIFGKVVVNGEEKLILKYHSCRDENMVGKILMVPLKENCYWLEDFINFKSNGKNFETKAHKLDGVKF
jgi:lysine 2,3-aminomutase